MSDEVLSIRSSALLSSNASNLLERWEQGLLAGKTRELTRDELAQAFSSRDDIARLIVLYQRDLDSINPAIIPYLSISQRKRLQKQLVRAHYLYSNQAQIDEWEIRLDGLARDRAQCKHYEALLHELTLQPIADEPVTPEKQLVRIIGDSEKPLGWAGMVLFAPFLAKNSAEFCEGKLGATKRLLQIVDQKPLYFGWSRTMVMCVVNGLFNQIQSKPLEAGVMTDLGVGLNYTSFFVVQTLFALELFLVLKNTLSGLWINAKSKLNIPSLFFYTYQLRSRQYVLLELLNMSISGIIGFLILFNEINPWPWAFVAMLGYRLAQLAILCFAYEARCSQERTYCKRIQVEWSTLNDRLKRLEKALELPQLDEANRANLELERAELRHEILILEKDYTQSVTDSHFKSIEFRNHLIQVLGLLVGATLFSCLIFPPAWIVPATGLIIGLCGAVICVVVTLITRTLQAENRLDGIEQDAVLIKQQASCYLHEFHRLKEKLPNPDVLREMKQLYLKLQQLVSESDYKQREVLAQQNMLAIDLLSDTLWPMALIVGLILLPTGISLGMILTVFFTNLLLRQAARWSKLSTEPMPVFNEIEFDSFLNDPHLNYQLKDNLKLQFNALRQPLLQHDRTEDNANDSFNDVSPEI